MNVDETKLQEMLFVPLVKLHRTGPKIFNYSQLSGTISSAVDSACTKL